MSKKTKFSHTKPRRVRRVNNEPAGPRQTSEGSTSAVPGTLPPVTVPAVAVPSAAISLCCARKAEPRRVFPNEPDSPRIPTEVTHEAESWFECGVGTLETGRWFAWDSRSDVPVIFDSPQAAAEYLWREGECDYGVLQLLQKVGWLQLNKLMINTSKEPEVRINF